MTEVEQIRPPAPRPCGCGAGHAGAAPCACAAGEIAMERNHYFTGKFMTARDFAHEQCYHRSRHQLHNRTLHGWGIVCGLKVVPHPSPDCRERWVVIEPGIALDCCGRELVLDHKLAVPIWEPPADHAAGTGPFLLSIYYDEQQIEPVPILYAEGGCDPTGHDFNRIRECIRYDVRPFTQAERDAGCWRTSDQSDDRAKAEEALRARCRPCGADDTAEGCISPLCVCAGMIPLAVITPRAIAGATHPPYFTIEAEQIDLSGRHNVRGGALTHVIGCNWRHGGRIKLSELLGPMQRRLKIFFDHEIQPRATGTGISRSTFRVEYRDSDVPGSAYKVALLYNDKEHSRPFLEHKCTAVFPIPDAFLEGSSKFKTGGVIHVTLKCDFVLDCNGRAVDGNHLGARLPSGDGVEGGDFESWFVVEDDLPHHRPDDRGEE